MKQGEKKPNFFILGAAKAGTTSLYDILKQHPQVYFPFDKEPAYFCDEDYFSRGENWYLKTFFSKAGSQPARGEATSRYLYFASKVAHRIKEFCSPDIPRLIAIFRDPASLVYSNYWNSVREGHETLTFLEAMKCEPERMTRQEAELERLGSIQFAYSRIAAYAQQVDAYLKYFPKDHFLFLLTEDLADFPKLVKNLQNFLSLNDLSSEIFPEKSNVAALPKNRQLHNWLRSRSFLKDMVKPFIPYSLRFKLKMAVLENNLEQFTPPELDAEFANQIRSLYAEDTKHLQDIIGRDLSKWLPN